MKEDSTDRNIGVEVRGTSNLSFEPNKAALSKVFSTAVDSNNKLYYCYQSPNQPIGKIHHVSFVIFLFRL